MKKQDLMHKRFGMLTVVASAEPYVSPKGYRKSQWNCVCDCGNTCAAMSSHLLSGHTKSCGCKQFSKLQPRVAKNLVGKRFGMLTVVRRLDNRMVGNYSRVVYECMCDCGKTTKVLALLLTGGLTKSCGCVHVSHPERVMKNYLSGLGVQYQSQYAISGLIGIGGGMLRFDFAILNEDQTIKCLVEIDGEQHRKALDYFGGMPKYERVVANDNIKNSWCESNDVCLIRINVSHSMADTALMDTYERVLHDAIFVDK